MRILALASRLPYPPVGGDRYRVFHLIRTAADAGHEVHLLAFHEHDPDPAALAALREAVASVEIVPLPFWRSALRSAQALVADIPLQTAYYRSDRMRRRVEAALRERSPEVVYTHLFRMAPYAIECMPRHRARWVLDFTDVISRGVARSLPYRRGPDRWLYTREGPRIARYERRIAPCFSECWVICESEAESLRRLAPGARVRVIPNGLPSEPIAPPSSNGGARLLFLGYQEVFHNRDAARFLVQDVFPRIRALIPEATLDIAGKGSADLPDWVRADGVRALGFVEDLIGTVRGASVFVAPHQCVSGVQNKVVLALACGVPVVTTPIVREGLEPIPDDVLMVAPDAEGIARAVATLLRDRESARALGARGRTWATERFTWEAARLAFGGIVPRGLEPATVEAPLTAAAV